MSGPPAQLISHKVKPQRLRDWLKLSFDLKQRASCLTRHDLEFLLCPTLVLMFLQFLTDSGHARLI